MKFGSAQVAPPTELRARLAEGTEVVGEMIFSEVLRIDSKLSGKVSSEEGNLVVSERGYVQATVDVGFVEVFGTIEGTVTAKYKVQIHPGGRVCGDIYTPILNIEAGALFDGKCHMVDDSRKPDREKQNGAQNALPEKLPTAQLKS
jgi:cytoskeletal protein CcmA (bactofilin family)